MPQISESEILHACRVLFGSDLHLNHDFLNYLQPSGVRTAYRQKAKTTHPDRFASSSIQIKSHQEKLFQNLNQAHEVVQSYLKQRSTVPGKAPHRTRSEEHSQPYPHGSKHGSKRFYQGLMPARPLQFAQFLYYRGLIPYAAVISAITWQRQQRPSMGEIARRWRWLSEHDISRILKPRAGFTRFGEQAERLGLLKPLQVRTLLLHQRSQQKQIGQYFVDQKYITEKTLERLLNDLSAHNRRHRHGFSGQFYTRS